MVSSLLNQLISLRGPERIRSFLWLVVHNRAMTNEIRYKRHMSGSPNCHCGSGDVETILHVLRDYKCVTPHLTSKILFALGLPIHLYPGLPPRSPSRVCSWQPRMAPKRVLLVKVSMHL